MIRAAATLFSRAGFHGVTTKDIAQSANVSEGNIFRYFPSKRELFLAALGDELNKLQERVRTRHPGAEACDSRAALRRLFHTISETVLREPAVVRLLQFGMLEFGAEIEPIYRRHLTSILSSWAGELERCSQHIGFGKLRPQLTVLSFVTTVMLLQLSPALTGGEMSAHPVESAAAEYAELWSRFLCDEAEAALTATELPQGSVGD